MGSYKKKLFIVLLLFLLISCFVCGSVNATTVLQEDSHYVIDIEKALQLNQEHLAYIFLNILEGTGNETAINNFKENAKNYNVFFSFYGESNSDVNRIRCYFYQSNIDFDNLSGTSSNINTDIVFFYDYYMAIPCSGYNLGSNDRGNNNAFIVNVKTKSQWFGNDTSIMFLPTLLIYYKNNTVNDYINGISPGDSPYSLIFQSIQENTEEQKDQTEELRKLNSFMSNEDVDEDAYDMPSENPTQDITEAGINGIFTMFYDKINNWESENITIRIPFANKIFIIPSDLTENIVNSYIPNTTTFGRLFGLIWYYLLGVYIVKDIQKYIDGLQTGEILTKSDTNIKTEML